MKRSTSSLMNLAFYLFLILIGVAAKSCKPAESLCLGNSLRICSEDGYWIETECPSGHSCLKNQGSISCMKNNNMKKPGIDKNITTERNDNEIDKVKNKEESSSDSLDLDEMVEIEPSAENKSNTKTRTVTITKRLPRGRKSTKLKEPGAKESGTKEKAPKEFQFEVSSQAQNGSKPVTYSLIFKKSPGADNIFNQIIPNETDINKKSQRNTDSKQNINEADKNNIMGSQQLNNVNNPGSKAADNMETNMQSSPNKVAGNQIPSQYSKPIINPSFIPQTKKTNPTVLGNQSEIGSLGAQTNPIIPSAASTASSQPSTPNPIASDNQSEIASLGTQTNPTISSAASTPSSLPTQLKPSTPQQPTSIPSTQPTTPIPSTQPTTPTQSPSDSKPADKPESGSKDSKKSDQTGTDSTKSKDSKGTETTNQKDSLQSSGKEMISKEALAKAMKECNYSPNPTYLDAIVKGVNSKYKDKEIVAMLLAQLAHESGGFQYIEEIACKNGCPGQYGTGAPGKSYHGRGFMQLSWPENYKKASEALGMGDKLYKNPEQVSKDVDIGVKVSFWYWDTRVMKNPKVASKQSFGESTKEINGALECKGLNIDKSKKRYANYKIIAKVMGIIKLASESGCYN